MARKDFKRATASVFLTAAPGKDTRDIKNIQNIENAIDIKNIQDIKDTEYVSYIQDMKDTQNKRRVLERGSPYRLNLKLKSEFKDYLAWASWERHESITQYLNRLIEQDYKKRAREYAVYLEINKK